MAWVLVPALQEFKEQLNELAPDRDKASDGSIGDYLHSQGTSSHNPDDTSKDNAEWDGDPDSTQEVRAIDVDVDFNLPGVTAQDVVNHLRSYAKNGVFWWIRYIIYNGRIYHRRDEFAPKAYTGVNPHDHHIHINNEFSQAADTVRNVDYRLNQLLPEDGMAVQDVAGYFDNVRQAVQNDGADGTDRDWRQDYAAATRYALGYNAEDQTTENLPPAQFKKILAALEDTNARLAVIEARLDSEETP
jgi:hypothetical protein